MDLNTYYVIMDYILLLEPNSAFSISQFFMTLFAASQFLYHSPKVAVQLDSLCILLLSKVVLDAVPLYYLQKTRYTAQPS